MQQSDDGVDVHMGLSICLFSRPLPSEAKYILYLAQKKIKKGEDVKILTALLI